jgi:hypothetical protein
MPILALARQAAIPVPSLPLPDLPVELKPLKGGSQLQVTYQSSLVIVLDVARAARTSAGRAAPSAGPQVASTEAAARLQHAGVDPIVSVTLPSGQVLLTASALKAAQPKKSLLRRLGLRPAATIPIDSGSTAADEKQLSKAAKDTSKALAVLLPLTHAQELLAQRGERLAQVAQQAEQLASAAGQFKDIASELARMY